VLRALHVWRAGRPVPKTKWTKNKAALPTDDNLGVSQKPEMCKLQIQKARRMDAGEYDLELENASGKINVPITIKVIGNTTVHCRKLRMGRNVVVVVVVVVKKR